MKIICNKSELIRGMNIALRAVSTKTTMPITGCVLVDASENEISLTGNDLESSAKTVVDGTIKEPGAIAVDAKIFNEIIRRFPDNEIKIQTDPGLNVMISSGRAKFNISGRDSDEFVKFPTVSGDKQLVVSQGRLKDAIQRTIFAISQNDSNKQMTGELFEFQKDGNLKITALDGHRVAIRDIDAHGDEPAKIIVPGKSLIELSKILSDVDSDVFINYDVNNIVFDIDDEFRFSTRTIYGDYFDVNKMMNPKFATTFAVERTGFIACLNRAAIIQREGDKKPVVFDIKGDVVQLFAQSATGAAEEEIEVSKTGDDMRIGFNPHLLLDALRAVPDDDVTLRLISPKAPCFIQGEGYIYIVLPVNL